MSRSGRTDKPLIPARQQLVGWGLGVCVILLIMFAARPLIAQEEVSSTFEYTQLQLSDEQLGVAHDELIMLIISLIVVVQICASYKFLKSLPFKRLLLGSFVAVCLSAFFTVAEGFVLSEVLNYLEHLSFMTAAILIALWCGRVFGFNKQEDS